MPIYFATFAQWIIFVLWISLSNLHNQLFNVWCIKTRTKHSSSLVRILMHQRLHFKISVICSCHLNHEERSWYILCISCFYNSLIQFAYYRIWIHKSEMFTKALLSYQSTDQTKSKMNHEKVFAIFHCGQKFCSALLHLLFEVKGEAKGKGRCSSSSNT